MGYFLQKNKKLIGNTILLRIQIKSQFCNVGI